MNISKLPTAVDVTLQRYNHMDNRLWTQLKNQLDYVEVDDRSIVVSIDQLRSFLEINYVSLVNKVKSSGAEFLHKKVNSPYFLYMMCIDMENLQLVKFTLDYDKKFTRLIENDGNKVLKFDFKILTMTLKLSDMFEKEDLAIINPVLEKLKILEEGVPYARLKMIDLLDTLDEWIASEIDRDLEEDEPDPIPLITTIMDTIDAKSESDDPLTLLVTDY
jgi:hypothetical protein